VRLSSSEGHRSSGRLLRAALCMAAAMVLVAAGGTAGAATSQATTGRVTLFQNPTYSGPVHRQAYVHCSGQLVGLTGLRQVGSYDNRPGLACQVLLINPTGATHELCAGRSVVPVEFRQSRWLRIEAGASQTCRSE
jgi:hypothetical protein